MLAADIDRGHWGSRLGFILAAAGSAVGLGNVWKFPYVTGVNGGGAFVLVYLACVALVGLPVMAAEILIGRASQRSPVAAFRNLGGGWWISIGWLGVTGGFIILSYYSVVAGWVLHYFFLALSGQITGLGPARVETLFGEVFGSAPLNLFWHLLFIGMTIGVVLGGVKRGVERASRILMPALFVMMVILLVKAFTMEGFGQGFDFIFGMHTESLTASGILEALGQAFFSLSLGMGSILTYGSYLRKDDDIVASAITISALDTLIALMASLVLFPIVFTFGLQPEQGPGLVFVTIPMGLSQMVGGGLMAVLFFGLLVFAALTSSISMLEVATSYLIDDKGWTRRHAALFAGGIIFVFGIPSALSGSTYLFGEGTSALVGKNWFDAADYLVSNWILPLGGLGIAIFTAWRMDEAIRHDHFLSGSKLQFFYKGWLLLLRFLVPVAIVFVFLHAIGMI